MKERIRLLRKTLKKTQFDFGAEIGVSDSTVGNWENGSNVPESARNLICQTFNVRREWLENGEGDIFESGETEISFADQMVALYMTLSPELRAVWREVAQKIIEAGNDSVKAATDVEEVLRAANIALPAYANFINAKKK